MRCHIDAAIRNQPSRVHQNDRPGGLCFKRMCIYLVELATALNVCMGRISFTMESLDNEPTDMEKR